MKIYKYFFILVILISGVVMIFNVNAVQTPPSLDVANIGIDGVVRPVSDIEGLSDIVVKILTWTYTIFFAVAVLFVLFAAYAYLGGGEDAEKIKNAHKKIIWASVAIAVALLALSVNLVVKNFIGASGGGGATSSNPLGGNGGGNSGLMEERGSIRENLGQNRLNQLQGVQNK